MRLVLADSERLVFAGRRSVRASLLVGLAFFIIAGAPIAIAVTVTPAIILTSFAALALGSTFLRAGWPIRRRVELRHGERTLDTGGGARPLPAGAELALVAFLEDEDVPRYRVELALSGSERVPLLQGRDPDQTVIELGRVLQSLPLPVKGGWALPSDAAPWLYPTSLGRNAAPEVTTSLLCTISPVPSQRDLGFTVLAFGVGAAALMTFEVVQRMRRGDVPTPLDVTLPVITSLAILVIGALVLGRRVQVRNTPDALYIVPALFGRIRPGVRIPRDAVRGVHPIGPPGKPEHVLFETTLGPLAVRCPDGEAASVASTIKRSL